MSHNRKLHIKLIARGKDGTAWAKQLPESGSFTGECSFHFDRDEPHYDWLVVIDDVSRKLTTPAEKLRCADEHTLLVTTEPPTITHFGKAFCAQYAHVMTSQPPEALQHPNRIYSHTGNLWFNGHSYRDLHGKPLPQKTRDLSTVCSSKQQKHTIHNDRYQFSHWLMQQIPSIDLYGHGSRFIEHKYDALDPYLFHLAIENHQGLHHWTEKLADSFLSGCFPIYYGCTNVADYFPPESFLEIDIHQRGEALEKIRERIDNPRFDSTIIDALHEARRRVMHEHNLLFMIELLALKHFNPALKPSGRLLFGRKQIRCLQPTDTLRFACWQIARRLKRH
ncbi:MAG: glycosyltransferase family 10 [Verrucomicrobiota bacterium]